MTATAATSHQECPSARSIPSLFTRAAQSRLRCASMDDVQGLYIVTAVVLVGLFGWVAAVLVRAPSAVDETKRKAPAAVPAPAPAVSDATEPDRLPPPPTEALPKATVAQDVAI